MKWVTADLPFGRGSPRNSQASSSATDHGANSFRGGRGFGRRGSNNGPMSTRGQGRNLNGDFRRPRQTNDDNANNSVENATTVTPTTTSSNQENGPKPVSVSAAAALSTANSRGSYQPRVRRGGVNRGAPAINRFPQPIPNPPIGVDGLVGANINASLATIHPSGHSILLISFYHLLTNHDPYTFFVFFSVSFLSQPFRATSAKSLTKCPDSTSGTRHFG